MDEIKLAYADKVDLIKSRIKDFRSLDRQNYFKEFIFCLLTPQSNAKKCWSAVEEISKLDVWNHDYLVEILKSRTRFHNNKAKYLMDAEKSWSIVKQELENKNRVELRNFISFNVKGYGLKEASHFLRNIGKSDNQIAILDRHILRNLHAFGVIENPKIKNSKDYLEIERKFINFSNNLGIPIDELDLLFWSKENGEIFK